MPSKDAIGIASGIVIEVDAKHDIGITQIVRVRRSQHFRVLQWRDSIASHTTPFNLIQTDIQIVGVFKVLRKARVDSGIEPTFKLSIPRMGSYS